VLNLPRVLSGYETWSPIHILKSFEKRELRRIFVPKRIYKIIEQKIARKDLPNIIIVLKLR
jgi:hypothetical protein